MSGAALPDSGMTVEAPGRHWSVIILRNRVIGVLIFEVIIGAVFAFSSKQFLTISNLNTIFLNACILSILACAEGVVIITRNYDVSVASTLALAAFVGFDLIKKYPEVGPVLVLVPILIGLVCGLINGAIVGYGKVSSIFVTLATLSVYRGIVTVYAQGHQIEPKDIGDWVRNTVTGSVLPGISNLALITLAVIVVVSVLLRYTRIGRQIYAIGSNPSASTFYGLKVSRVVLGAYALCGALTGLSGFLFAARSSYVVPWFAQGLELQVIGSVVVGGISVLGGSGNVVGAALGAMVLTTMDNGLILVGTSEVIRQLLYGAAIVGACTFDAIVLQQVSSLLKSRRRRGTRR